jgi:hypothetical protein
MRKSKDPTFPPPLANFIDPEQSTKWWYGLCATIINATANLVTFLSLFMIQLVVLIIQSNG